MNKDLINFINICLVDGVISEKERKVIFQKANELGISENECEILIESLTQQKLINEKVIQKKTSLKRDFKKKQLKSIPPAKLDMEPKIREVISKLEKEVDNLNKEKDNVSIKIKDSSKILNDKKDVLKKEFPIFKLNFNRDFKNYIDSLFSHVEKEISQKFGKTSIVINDNEKYNWENLKETPEWFEQPVSKQGWQNTEAEINYNRSLEIAGGSGCLGLIFFFVFGWSQNILFIVFGVFLFLLAYFKMKKNAKPVNFSKNDILKEVKKYTSQNKSKIDDLKNNERIITRVETIYGFTKSKTKKNNILNRKPKTVDQILDKIKATGYESLTKAEKDFLFDESKNI